MMKGSIRQAERDPFRGRTSYVAVKFSELLASGSEQKKVSLLTARSLSLSLSRNLARPPEHKRFAI